MPQFDFLPDLLGLAQPSLALSASKLSRCEASFPVLGVGRLDFLSLGFRDLLWAWWNSETWWRYVGKSVWPENEPQTGCLYLILDIWIFLFPSEASYVVTSDVPVSSRRRFPCSLMSQCFMHVSVGMLIESVWPSIEYRGFILLGLGSSLSAIWCASTGFSVPLRSFQCPGLELKQTKPQEPATIRMQISFRSWNSAANIWKWDFRWQAIVTTSAQLFQLCILKCF